MAKGKRCRECNDSMYAQTEKYELKGTWVTTRTVLREAVLYLTVAGFLDFALWVSLH